MKEGGKYRHVGRQEREKTAKLTVSIIADVEASTYLDTFNVTE